jgi:hypothetical protein
MAHNQEVVGSNPGTVYWMAVSDASYYINTKITKNKGSQMGNTKKYIYKRTCLLQSLKSKQSPETIT